MTGSDGTRAAANTDQAHAIATALVRSAGVGRAATRLALLGDSTNQVWSVEVDNGAAEAVLALHDRAGDEHDRCAKERFLHDLVYHHGVPAPRLLATDDRGGFSARLIDHLPGLRADVALRQSPVDDQAEIWCVIGAMIRRIHGVRLPDWAAGEIVGDRVVPFTSDAGGPLTWGQYILGDMARDLASLANELGLPAIEPTRVAAVVVEAGEHLDAVAPVLIHNDPRLANVLVERRDGRWRCTGWLDWEFARVGEPSFDLARLDLWRSQQEPAVPEAFWAGYGESLDAVNLAVSRLAVAICAAQAQRGSDEPDRYAPALGYLADLGQHVADLERLCAGR